MSETFGVSHDDPRKLWNRADRQLSEALRDSDLMATREACEHLWLAVCAAVDVAGLDVSGGEHGGYSGRVNTLGKLGVGRLVAEFGWFRSLLHGEIFHGDRKDDDLVLRETSKAASSFIDAVDAALKKWRRK